ncbi:hypothetical protein MMPV_009860 [Pyropia vietnamensis]
MWTPAPPPPGPTMPTVIGGYRLSRVLGRGNYGVVRLAVTEATGEPVAIKILQKAAALSTPTALCRVRREVRIMRSLSHPNIARLVETLSSPTRIYLVMEYVAGTELFDVMLSTGALPEDRARRIWAQIVGALNYAHGRGVVHRDAKLENVLITPGDGVKLIDWGFGTGVAEGEGGLLHTGCGSLHYSAPEIVSYTPGGYDGRLSDAWAAGVMLYVLLTGGLPFLHSDPAELRHLITSASPVLPSTLSPSARHLLTGLLTKEPSCRYSLRDAATHPWLTGASADRGVHAPVGPEGAATAAVAAGVSTTRIPAVTGRRRRSHTSVPSSPTTPPPQPGDDRGSALAAASAVTAAARSAGPLGGSFAVAPTRGMTPRSRREHSAPPVPDRPRGRSPPLMQTSPSSDPLDGAATAATTPPRRRRRVNALTRPSAAGARRSAPGGWAATASSAASIGGGWGGRSRTEREASGPGGMVDAGGTTSTSAGWARKATRLPTSASPADVAHHAGGREGSGAGGGGGSGSGGGSGGGEGRGGERVGGRGGGDGSGGGGGGGGGRGGGGGGGWSGGRWDARRRSAGAGGGWSGGGSRWEAGGSGGGRRGGRFRRHLVEWGQRVRGGG